MINAEKNDIQFPAPWEFRLIAFADKSAGVRAEVIRLLEVEGQAPSLSDGNTSGGGKYAALRLTATVNDREHLKRFAEKLAAIDGVKMVL